MRYVTPDAIPVWQSLAGGGLIGASAAVLLLLDGRVAGISGILGQSVRGHFGDQRWRLTFLAGLLGPALLLGPGAVTWQASASLLGVAGLLVGLGTGIGGGCTSGHGVCGLANLSLRSLVATLTFLAAAALTVFVVHRLVSA